MLVNNLTEYEQMQLSVMLTNKYNLYMEVLVLVEEMKSAKTDADVKFIQNELEHNEFRMHQNEDAILDFMDENKDKYEENLGK